MKRAIPLAAALVLSACATAPTTVGAPAARVPVPYRTLGLERVLGRDAASIVALFGPPVADVREGPGRKLQFSGGICVLDAYLYPQGNKPPVVTHLDARQLDGRDIDRASCVASLAKR